MASGRTGGKRSGIEAMLLLAALAAGGVAPARAVQTAPAAASQTCAVTPDPGGESAYGHGAKSAALRRAFDRAIADDDDRLSSCLADVYLGALQDERALGFVLDQSFDHVIAAFESIDMLEEAEWRLEEFILANPGQSLILLQSKIDRRARLLVRLGEPAKASKALEQLTASPDFAAGQLSRDEIWYSLALIARAEKDPRAALANYAKIAAQAREYPTILDWEKIVEYAQFLEEQGQPKAAEAEYLFLIETQSEYQQVDQPNGAARRAMNAYAAFLEAQNRPDAVQFYRLPLQIANAVEMKQPEVAKTRARALYAEAKRLFKPADANYRRALQFYAAVVGADDVLYDLPADLRRCGPWPIPVTPRAVSTTPMPMIVSSGPRAPSEPEKIYFTFSRRPVVESDLVGGFLSAVPDLARYAQICAASGDLQKAAELLAELAARGRALDYTPGDLQPFYLAEAPLWVQLDDFPRAEKAYLAAADSVFSRQYLSLYDSGKLFNNLIRFYLDFGQYDRAEAQILRFLETDAVASYDAYNLGIIRNQLVDIYVAQGKPEKAVNLLVRNMPDRPVIDDNSTRDTANLYQGWNTAIARYANALNAAGLYTRSIDMLVDEEKKIVDDLKALQAKGLTIYDFQARRAVNNLYEPLGDAYLATGRATDAVTAYGKAIGITENELGVVSGPEQLLPVYYRLLASHAAAAVQAGQPDVAEKAYRAAADIAPRLPRPPEEAQNRLWTVSMALGAADPALRARGLGDGKRLVEWLDRQWLISQQSGIDAASQVRRLREMPGYYGRFASLLWQDATENGKPPPTDEAVRVLQRASLTSVDVSLGASIAKSVLLRDRPELLALTEEREKLGRALTRSTAGLSEAIVRDEYRDTTKVAPREVNDLVNRIQDIDRQLAAAAPDYFAFLGGERLDASQLRALTRPSEAILMLVPSAVGTHAVTITADAVHWQLLDIDEGEIDAAVRRLLWFSGADFTPSVAEVNSWTASVDGGLSGFDRDTAFAIYQKLIAPLLPRLVGHSHLVIAGSGALASLPFGMLVTQPPPGADDNPDDLRATAWFADQFALVQVPSLQSLSLLRRYADAAPAAADAHFIGFGDPALEGAPAARGARGATRNGPGGTEAIYAKADVGSALVVDPAKLLKMARLLGTKTEIEALAKAFGTDSETFLGAAANETRVRGMDLRKGNILAFATHGLTTGEEGGLAEPGLVLTPPAKASAADDGYLSASEIAGLRLDADWVILSACNTAAGDGSRGATGLSGLAKAFFYAGARNLLASHWPVRDDVASRLTVRIVEIAREKPDLTRAQAFQAAMAEIRSEKAQDGKKMSPDGFEIEQSWAHPNAWAPFTLIGQGSRKTLFQ